MDCSEKTLSDLVGILKSWIPRKAEPANVSKDFWMPDHICRVCYECDSQFTLFNRRHHCRLCGRVFCAKCTSNSVPIPFDNSKNGRDGGERIRVCNFCFKQWEQDKATVGNRTRTSSMSPTPSLSVASVLSTHSIGTFYSSFRTACSISQSIVHNSLVQNNLCSTPHQSVQIEHCYDKLDLLVPAKDIDTVAEIADPISDEFLFNMKRSHDANEYATTYSEAKPFQRTDDCYGETEFKGVVQHYDFTEACPAEELDSTNEIFSSLPDDKDFYSSLGVNQIDEDAGPDSAYDHDMPSSIYSVENKDEESVDFESNGLLWLPPDPEDEEDDIEADLFDDEDEDDACQWGYFHNSNGFSCGDYQNRDQIGDEHKTAMNNVVGGHFRSLVAQLLQVENIPLDEEDDVGSWLEIITSLSWEAATFLKPDTSKGGGMDPGGYVKVKCIACGARSESMVVKGIVCKKNVAHRRMVSKIEKPRFLILGGALEYQRVTNLLSSFDTLLQQEMDHLKMAVAKIEAHKPDVLLVEKSVSRFAQDCLLEKNISLVLNIKRSLLERIARCTGARIVPSIDHLLSQKLGHCELFHVDKFFEEHGTAGLGGKKTMKNLMFFEGCPKPLGCTVLLKGANGDELKKVKHVVQYGIFAAYHLAMETCFLADEGASLPELSSSSAISVGFPNKTCSINKSISMVPCSIVSAAGKQQPSGMPQVHNLSAVTEKSDLGKRKVIGSQFSSEGFDSLIQGSTSTFINPLLNLKVFHEDNNDLESAVDRFVFSSSSASAAASVFSPQPILSRGSKSKNKAGFTRLHELEAIQTDGGATEDSLLAPLDYPGKCEAFRRDDDTQNESRVMVADQIDTSNTRPSHQDYDHKNEHGLSKEEFAPSSSDHQSILVSLSIRCVWKGTVCERPHLFRIKFYGSFDKPLGRFLRDHLFDQSYRCPSCDMPSEAHVHCYTHREGSLTISVRKLPEFLLAGERDGKIWMWHRCLRCPRIDGLPPATQRVVMSDAAWGLSFGKFMELSFSNHAAASRVASCGHSIHKDCLRFYGYGKMVACFRYGPISVHSVYLPPLKVKFNYQIQEWIQKEADEVADWGDFLFTDAVKALSQIIEKASYSMALGSNVGVSVLPRCIIELEELLQKEKMEFEESLQKLVKNDAREGQPVIDILEVNKLRRQLLFQSYLWDQRLIYAASSPCELPSELLSIGKEKFVRGDKLVSVYVTSETEGGITGSNAVPSDNKMNDFINRSVHLVEHQEGLHDHSNILNTDKENKDVRLGSFYVKPRKPNLTTRASATVQLDPLEPNLVVHRTLSEGHFPITANLSDALDAKWTGNRTPPPDSVSMSEPAALIEVGAPASVSEDSEENVHLTQYFLSALLTKQGDNAVDLMSWIGTPSISIYNSFNKNWGSAPRFDALSEYIPIYIPSFLEMKHQTGARLLLPNGVYDRVIPVFDDEPTSIIAYALASTCYHLQMSNEQDSLKSGGDSSLSLHLLDSVTFHQFHLVNDMPSEHYTRSGFADDSISSLSGSSSLISDPLNTKAMHLRVPFVHEGKQGKVKYNVTCYYAKRFDALRRACCPSELDFIRSLSRCRKWGAQGGKSNVFFAKTLDDRFIVKQVRKTELDSFIKFAPEYFKYLSESIGTRSPTCLAKILGMYQVTSKQLKGGKESRLDVLVMENLLFERNISRLYDLKGSSRSRYNPDSSGENKVLLDQNLIEALPTSPIFVGNKAKRLLERAVWNDTSFLASIDVMDYSLLVGIDDEAHELVLGIIDFMRQYTWDKHLETWVKASGILGGPKNALPTVISPKQYKKRFRKAMSAYFLMVPDQWLAPSIVPDKLDPNLSKNGLQGGLTFTQ